MKVLIICDKDIKTDYSEALEKQLFELFLHKGFEIRIIQVGKQELKSCIGCFGCWIKTPGKCVIKDLIGEINRNYISSDTVIYLTPVIFGQYSSNIKNVIDRSQPYVLPFFKKINGTTKHPLRYEKNPKEIIIAYNDEIIEEEKNTFLDLINKHERQHRDIYFSLSKESNKEIVEKIKEYV
ncbi:flavodoxin [Clostridium zeae]|uniref:Flavodoxin n=1 Tax=Clostridium zeae TaxID=2759022 RepID=A0ABQ1EEH1_9CLOT|nr:flavodoxin family protein [Clostridium zeae]GFZ33211.1 flavodoxin [Clostridium zeae]